ncbi:MAG: isochorismatase family cysteine hydrolase [Erysipelotrichaceae bacterium]
MSGNTYEKHELLVVVDMIRGFIEQGPLADPAISHIIGDNVELIKDFTKRGQPVIAFRDAHAPDSKEFAFYPAHCVKGTKESELVDAIAAFEDRMIVIEKDTTNGFQTAAFQAYIADEVPFERIVVIGCCTDICVLQFVLSLKTYLQQRRHDTEVVVVQDCVETFEIPGHPRSEFNEFSFKLMKNAGISLPAHWEK